MSDARNTVLLGWIHPGTVAGAFMTSVLDLAWSESENVVGYVALESGPLISRARDRLAELFMMDRRLPQWLFMLDSDMVIPSSALRSLLDAAERLQRNEQLDLPPVVAGLYFTGGRRTPVHPTTWKLERSASHTGRRHVTIVHDYPRGELVRVDATGAGCLLIHRDVLGAIVGDAAGADEYPFFGDEMGEDVTFCVRASAAGARIYVDTAVRCGHVRSVVVDEAAYDAEREAIASRGAAAVSGFFGGAG